MESHNQEDKIVNTGIAWAQTYTTMGSSLFQPHPSALSIRQSPPTTGWIKLNIDEMVSDMGIGGGVFRDVDANWLCGFSMVVNMESIFQVEAQAIFEGLNIAWTKGFQ